MSQPISSLDVEVLRAFGPDRDPIEAVEARARRLFPGAALIVWEGDPQTFAFSYVGGDAERLLGYPGARWVEEATFWSDRVIHPDDRSDAVAYCALATARATDHVFEYRALTADGGVRWLKDYVRVILGARRIPVVLRGLMFDVTEAMRASAGFDALATFRLPTVAELELAA